jgi:TonB family protein
MRWLLCLAVTVCFTLFGSSLAQASPTVAPRSLSAPSAEAPDELRQVLQEAINAAAANDADKLAMLIKGMEIPNADAWFAQNFASGDAAKMSALYWTNLAQEESLFPNVLKQLGSRQGEFSIQRLNDMAEPEDSHRALALRTALQQPTDFYYVSWASPQKPDSSAGPTPDFSLGYFILLDGSYRRLSSQFVMYLSTFEQYKGTLNAYGDPVWPQNELARIRQGGNITAKSLIDKVSPVYPPLAVQARIEGTVRLHTIIAKDGTVLQIEVMSGHPLLVQAAIDAVRQWRYRPTLLNGEPVEVDTTVDVIFSIKP